MRFESALILFDLTDFRRVALQIAFYPLYQVPGCQYLSNVESRDKQLITRFNEDVFQKELLKPADLTLIGRQEGTEESSRDVVYYSALITQDAIQPVHAGFRLHWFSHDALKNVKIIGPDDQFIEMAYALHRRKS